MNRPVSRGAFLPLVAIIIVLALAIVGFFISKSEIIHLPYDGTEFITTPIPTKSSDESDDGFLKEAYREGRELTPKEKVSLLPKNSILGAFFNGVSVICRFDQNNTSQTLHMKEGKILHIVLSAGGADEQAGMLLVEKTMWDWDHNQQTYLRTEVQSEEALVGTLAFSFFEIGDSVAFYEEHCSEVEVKDSIFDVPSYKFVDFETARSEQFENR